MCAARILYVRTAVHLNRRPGPKGPNPSRAIAYRLLGRFQINHSPALSGFQIRTSDGMLPRLATDHAFAPAICMR